MNRQAGFWITAVCAFCQGCSPLANCARTMFIEPFHFSGRFNDHADKRNCRAWADNFWLEFQASCPEVVFSESFEKGFKVGFVEYLYAGGPGNPPPIPPRSYWNARYESPEGHRVIEDWFAGYRQGAAIAQSSGYRELITVPASTALRRSQSVTNWPARDVLPVPEELPAKPAAQGFPPPQGIPDGARPELGAPKFFLPPRPLKDIPYPVIKPDEEKAPLRLPEISDRAPVLGSPVPVQATATISLPSDSIQVEER